MERLKRIMMMVAVAIMMLAGTVFAGYDEAVQLYRDKKYVEAEAELRKALPELKGDQAYNVQIYIGYVLRDQGKHDEAMAEFGKLKDIAGATPDQIGNAEYDIGGILGALKRFDEARAKFLEIAEMKGISEGQYRPHMHSIWWEKLCDYKRRMQKGISRRCYRERICREYSQTPP